MSAMSLRLPESLHRRVRELARREGISINQLVSTAVAEKMSALMTAEYLQTRAARASRANWRAALAAVPATEALSDDEWGTEAPNPLPALFSGE
jgi:hypothetical protein